MKVNINPTNIAEAVLLLHSEELLQSLEDTVFVLSHSQDTDEDEITFFYFSDGSYMSVSPDFEYQSHDRRK